MTNNKTTVAAVLAVLDRAAEITNRMTFSVPAHDFGTWLEALGEKTFYVNLSGDEGTDILAHVAGFHNATYYAVSTIASGIDGHEVPERDAEDMFLTLPASEAVKLRERVTV